MRVSFPLNKLFNLMYIVWHYYTCYKYNKLLGVINMDEQLLIIGIEKQIIFFSNAIKNQSKISEYYEGQRDAYIAVFEMITHRKYEC